MAKEAIEYAGQVVVDSIVLYSGDRKSKLDISLMFNELDIFEDLYSPIITGQLRIIEGFNLVSMFPILGEEMLEFTCHTPTFDTKISIVFAVVGVSDKIVDAAKKQIYTLDLISANAVVDINSKVYRAYTGAPSDSAVEVFKHHFPGSKIKVEASSNNIKVVGATITPFKMINLLASKALDMSSYAAPNFVFFENNQEYNFVSMSTLFSQKPITALKWSHSQMRTRNPEGESIRDINEEYANVKDITIDGLFHTMVKAMSGSMGKTVLEVDLLRKAITRKTYNYMDNFKDTEHLNLYPVNSNNLVRSDETIVEAVPIFPYAHNSISSDRDADVSLKRHALLSQNEYIKLQLIIHGRSDMKVGDVIRFDMGTFKTGDETDKRTEDRLDPYYSGNYLISAIRHRFTLQRHEAVIEVIAESFKTKIPQ